MEGRASGELINCARERLGWLSDPKLVDVAQSQAHSQSQSQPVERSPGLGDTD
jgi:hypothetical protein